MAEHEWNDGAGQASGSGGGRSNVELVRQYGPPALLAIVAVLFIVQNRNKVKFEFLGFDFESPLWLILTIFALAGAFAGWWIQRRRTRRAD